MLDNVVILSTHNVHMPDECRHVMPKLNYTCYLLPADVICHVTIHTHTSATEHKCNRMPQIINRRMNKADVADW